METLIGLLILSLLCLVPVCDGQLEITVTCDNEVKLHIDGVLQTPKANAADWSKSDTYPILPSARVIGIECEDRGGLAGIMATLSDGTFTDSSWECSTVLESGWSTSCFVPGNSWNPAVSFGTNGNPGHHSWKFVNGISSSTNWIWTRPPILNNPDLFKTVYCRKEIGEPIAPQKSITATCDNEMKLYIDGVLQTPKANAADWTKSDTYPISASAQVIGIECRDKGVVPGIMATFSDGTFTDSSWECSKVLESGWSSPGFNPGESWNFAVTFGTNGNPGYHGWRTVSGISLSTYWIWRTGPLINNPDENKTIYCRKVIAAVTSDCAPGKKRGIAAYKSVNSGEYLLDTGTANYADAIKALDNSRKSFTTQESNLTLEFTKASGLYDVRSVELRTKFAEWVEVIFQTYDDQNNIVESGDKDYTAHPNKLRKTIFDNGETGVVATRIVISKKPDADHIMVRGLKIRTCIDEVNDAS